MKDSKKFKQGDWIVSKMSFGTRIIRMEVDGEFNGVSLRHATDEDLALIESSVWNNGRKVYEGRFPHKGFSNPADMQASF